MEIRPRPRPKSLFGRTTMTVSLTVLVLLALSYQLHVLFEVDGGTSQSFSLVSPLLGKIDLMEGASVSSHLPVPTQPQRTISSTNDAPSPLTIVVLAMDRMESLQRLLKSLLSSQYGSDRVNLVLRFDRPNNTTAQWLQNVETIRNWTVSRWRHGNSNVVVASKPMGLRQAWLEAWRPVNDNDWAIIFEDDVEVSPLWYRWLRGAHEAYAGRDDVAGFSLQRQTLVPLESAKGNQIPDNNGLPFLYRLVGSIGFSPKASTWRDFLDFAECALAIELDVSVKGLITSTWYNRLDKRSMWTQLFIYFCNYQKLSTVYWFPPNNVQALAAHWREKGEHFGATQGRDFDIFESPMEAGSFEYPSELTSLDWNAKPLRLQDPLRSLVMSVALGYTGREFNQFVVGLRRHYKGDVALLVSSSAPVDVKQMLADNNVITVETEEQGGPRVSPAWTRIIKTRYAFYKEQCREDSYDLCMMVDFRDVLFQADPFEHMSVPSQPSLYLYLHRLHVNQWTMNEVSKCTGGNVKWLEGKWIINAGGMVASPSVISKLHNINEQFGIACDDQVALNLAVYGNKIPDVDVRFHEQGTGSINNAAWGGVFRRDSRRRILNRNCFPAPVVHQYDVIEETRAIAARQG